MRRMTLRLSSRGTITWRGSLASWSSPEAFIGLSNRSEPVGTDRLELRHVGRQLGGGVAAVPQPISCATPPCIWPWSWLPFLLEDRAEACSNSNARYAELI